MLCSNFQSALFQILTSVPVTMVVVYKSVPTLLVATHVDVTLDMSWMEMDSLAAVISCCKHVTVIAYSFNTRYQ